MLGQPALESAQNMLFAKLAACHISAVFFVTDKLYVHSMPVRCVVV